jgi:hypothetical protein
MQLLHIRAWKLRGNLPKLAMISAYQNQVCLGRFVLTDRG